MHVKAFGVMTRHPVKKEQLPTDLREAAPVDEKGRIDRPPREFRAEIFTRFREALEPLRSAGKLGGTLFQFPPYVVYKDLSLDYLAWARRADGRRRGARRVPPRELVRGGRSRRGARVPRGARDVARRRGRAEGRGEERPADAARRDRADGLRAVPRAQREDLEVRGGSAAERFDYLYSDDELREWVEPLRELADQAQNAYAFFNNNNRSPGDGGYGGYVPRPPRTRRCSRSCLQKLLQQLVEAVPALDVREVTGALEHLEAAVRRRLDDLPRLVLAGGTGPRCRRPPRAGARSRGRTRSSRAGRGAPRSRGSAPPRSARAEAARARSAPRRRCPAHAASRSRRCGRLAGRRRRRRLARRPGRAPRPLAGSRASARAT